jgi:hypothetical protein
MSRNIITFIAGALLLASPAAHATVMEGDFSGTINSPGGGSDVTGVFGEAAGTDLSGDPVTGTFTYNTALLSQSISGGVNNATGTGLGALTVTLTINGVNYTFTDNSSASILLDTNASEATIQNANTTGGSNDSFSLDASDLFNPFITSTDLTATWSTTNPFSSTGSFAIDDAGAEASGSFTLGTFEVTGQVAAPEPASMALLGVGLAGIAGCRGRRGRYFQPRRLGRRMSALG